MSQFAAGCAVCGYDLEAARREASARGPTISERIGAAQPGWLGSPTARQDLFVVTLTVVLIVFFPIVGGALAAWTAYDRNRNGDLRMRNAAFVLLVIAVVFVALPELRFGIVSLLA